VNATHVFMDAIKVLTGHRWSGDAGDMIYVAVSSAKGAVAYQLISSLSVKHGIGVCDVSDNGEFRFRQQRGGLKSSCAPLVDC
jgi:hypothetical protein